MKSSLLVPIKYINISSLQHPLYTGLWIDLPMHTNQGVIYKETHDKEFKKSSDFKMIQNYYKSVSY